MEIVFKVSNTEKGILLTKHDGPKNLVEFMDGKLISLDVTVELANKLNVANEIILQIRG